MAVAPGTTRNAAEYTSADGRHIRYIATRSAEELAAKLAIVMRGE